MTITRSNSWSSNVGIYAIWALMMEIFLGVKRFGTLFLSVCSLVLGGSKSCVLHLLLEFKKKANFIANSANRVGIHSKRRTRLPVCHKQQHPIIQNHTSPVSGSIPCMAPITGRAHIYWSSTCWTFRCQKTGDGVGRKNELNGWIGQLGDIQNPQN